MKWLKRLGALLCASLLLWGGVVLNERATHGFNLRQITSFLPHDPKYDPAPISEEEKEHLTQLLDQPFTYLGKGAQSYAFASEDGRYVLKFIKYKHFRQRRWLRYLSKKWVERISEKKKRRLDGLFASFSLAFKEVPEQTGLLYLHLASKEVFGKRVTLIDRSGLRYPIYLDRYEYIIQKKGTPLAEVLQSLSSKEELTPLLKEIEKLLCERSKKGVRDLDCAVVQNMAITDEGKALFIDIGQYVKDHTLLESEVLEQEVSQRKQALIGWMKEHCKAFSSLSAAFSS